nr:MAG TPA: hypothetical protein [Caudoviricetes sp.]
MIPDVGDVADDVGGSIRLVICCGRSCLADAAGLPRFAFVWRGF